MFIPFSTSNAKHCRLGAASDFNPPSSHDETGFFFPLFFSSFLIIGSSPPLFFDFLLSAPPHERFRIRPGRTDGWTTTTIRMGKRCTALAGVLEREDEMSGYGGRVLESKGWVYNASGGWLKTGGVETESREEPTTG